MEKNSYKQADKDRINAVMKSAVEKYGYLPPNTKLPNRTKPIKGKSGNTYSSSVTGKTTSELLRMGYTNAEIDDIKHSKLQPQAGGQSAMRFSNRSYHRSSSVEKFASNLSALESILGFRRRHRALFNVIMAGIIIIAILTVLALVWAGMRSSRNSMNYNQGQIQINQPTSVQTENDIKHERTSDGLYSSTINYAFETDFVFGNGVNEGDTYSMALSIFYRGSDGKTYNTTEEYIDIIAGERAGLTTDIINSTGFISVDDILGYNMR